MNTQCEQELFHVHAAHPTCWHPEMAVGAAVCQLTWAQSSAEEVLCGVLRCKWGDCTWQNSSSWGQHKDRVWFNPHAAVLTAVNTQNPSGIFWKWWAPIWISVETTSWMAARQARIRCLELDEYMQFIFFLLQLLCWQIVLSGWKTCAERAVPPTPSWAMPWAMGSPCSSHSSHTSAGSKSFTWVRNYSKLLLFQQLNLTRFRVGI